MAGAEGRISWIFATSTALVRQHIKTREQGRARDQNPADKVNASQVPCVVPWPSSATSRPSLG